MVHCCYVHMRKSIHIPSLGFSPIPGLEHPMLLGDKNECLECKIVYCKAFIEHQIRPYTNKYAQSKYTWETPSNLTSETNYQLTKPKPQHYIYVHTHTHTLTQAQYKVIFRSIDEKSVINNVCAYACVCAWKC